MDIPLPGEPDPELSKLSGGTTESPCPYNIPLPTCAMQFSVCTQQSVPSHVGLPEGLTLPQGSPPPLPPGTDQLDDPNRYSPSGATAEDECSKHDQSSAPGLQEAKSRRVTVLGKAQAKKRLLAFSMTKQGGGSGLSFGFSKKAVPKVNAGSAKAFAGAVMEDESGENRENKNEKPIAPSKKKGSGKKGPTREDKARAVVSAIEEIKREELLMRGVLGYGQAMNMAGDMTAPLPLLGQPLLPPAKPKEDLEIGNVLSEQQKGAIELLIDSLLTHDGDKKGSDRGDGEKDREKSSDRRKSEKDERKKDVDKSSRSKDRIRSKDRHSRSTRDREKEEKKKNRPTELPVDWAHFRSGNYKLEEIRRLKLKLEKDKLTGSSRDRHRNRSRERRSRSREERKRQKSPQHHTDKMKTSECDYDHMYRPFESTPKLRFPFMAVGIRQLQREYPRSLIRYTKARPSVPYCENPSTSKAYYRTRIEIMSDASPRIARLMQNIIDGNNEQVQVKTERNKQADANLSSSLAALQVSYDETEIEENMSSSDDINGNKKERSWYIHFSALVLLWSEGEEQDGISQGEVDVKKEKLDDDDMEVSCKKAENSVTITDMKENELSNYMNSERDRESNVPDSGDTGVGLVSAERPTVRSKWDSDYEEDKMSVDGTNTNTEITSSAVVEISVQNEQDSWSKTESEVEYPLKGEKNQEEEEMPSKQSSENDVASDSDINSARSLCENVVEELTQQGSVSETQGESKFNSDEHEQMEGNNDGNEETLEEPVIDVCPQVQKMCDNDTMEEEHTVEGSADLKLVSEYEEFMKAVSFDTNVVDDDHMDKLEDGELITAEESENSILLPVKELEENVVEDGEEDAHTDGSHVVMNIEPVDNVESQQLKECSEIEIQSRPKLMTSSASEDELLVVHKQRSHTKSKSPEKVVMKFMNSRRDVQHALYSSEGSSTSSDSSDSESEIEDQKERHRCRSKRSRKKKKKHSQMKKKRKKMSKKRRAETSSSSESDSSSEKGSSSSSSSDEREKRRKKHRESSKRRASHHSSSDKSGDEGSSGEDQSSDGRTTRKKRSKVKRSKKTLKKKENKRRKNKRRDSLSSESDDNCKSRHVKSSRHKESNRKGLISSKKLNEIAEVSNSDTEKKNKEIEDVIDRESSKFCGNLDHKNKREKKKLKKANKKCNYDKMGGRKKEYDIMDEKCHIKNDRKGKASSSNESSDDSSTEELHKRKVVKNREGVLERRNVNSVESGDDVQIKKKKKMLKKRRRDRRSQSVSPVTILNKKRRRSPSTSPEHSPTPQRRNSTEGKKSHGEGMRERSGEGRKLKQGSGGKKKGKKQGEVDSSDDPDISSSSERDGSVEYVDIHKRGSAKDRDENQHSKWNSCDMSTRQIFRTNNIESDDFNDKEVEESDMFNDNLCSRRNDAWWPHIKQEYDDSMPEQLLNLKEIKQEVMSEEEEKLSEKCTVGQIVYTNRSHEISLCSEQNIDSEEIPAKENVAIDCDPVREEIVCSQDVTITSRALYEDNDNSNDYLYSCVKEGMDSEICVEKSNDNTLLSSFRHELYSPENPVNDAQFSVAESTEERFKGDDICGVDSSSQLSEIPSKPMDKKYDSDMSLDSNGNADESVITTKPHAVNSQDSSCETSYSPSLADGGHCSSFESESKDSYMSASKSDLHRSGLILSLDNIPLPPPLKKSETQSSVHPGTVEQVQTPEVSEPPPSAVPTSITFPNTDSERSNVNLNMVVSSIDSTPRLPPEQPVTHSRPIGKHVVTQKHVITFKLLSPSSRFQAAASEFSNKVDLQSSCDSPLSKQEPVSSVHAVSSKTSIFSSGTVSSGCDSKMGVSSSTTRQSWKAIGMVEHTVEDKKQAEVSGNVTPEVSSSTSKSIDTDAHRQISTVISEAIPKERQRKRPSRWGMMTAPAKKLAVQGLYENIVPSVNEVETTVCSSFSDTEAHQFANSKITEEVKRTSKSFYDQLSADVSVPSDPAKNGKSVCKGEQELDEVSHSSTWVEKQEKVEIRKARNKDNEGNINTEKLKDWDIATKNATAGMDEIARCDYHEREGRAISLDKSSRDKVKESQKKSRNEWSIDMKDLKDDKDMHFGEKKVKFEYVDGKISCNTIKKLVDICDVRGITTMEPSNWDHSKELVWESRSLQYRSNSRSISPYLNREEVDHGRGSLEEKRASREIWDKQDVEPERRKNEERENSRWDDKGWREIAEHDGGRREEIRKTRDDLERDNRRDDERGGRDDFERDGGHRTAERSRREEIDRDGGRREDDRDRREEVERSGRRDDDRNRRDDVDRDSIRRDDDNSRREDNEREGARREDDRNRREFSDRDRDRSSGGDRDRREARDRRDERRSRDQRDRDRERDRERERRSERDRRDSRWEREKRDRRRDERDHDRSRSPSHDYRRGERDRRDGRREERDNRKDDCEHSRSPVSDYWHGDWDRAVKDRELANNYYIGDIPLPIAGSIQEPVPWTSTSAGEADMELSCSPASSPLVGFKRSLADSTISDSELISCKQEEALLHSHHTQDTMSPSSTMYHPSTIPCELYGDRKQSVYYIQQHTSSPSQEKRTSPVPSPAFSPKRLSLDDRIEMELGVKKSPPPQSVVGQHQIFHHQSYPYSNYYSSMPQCEVSSHYTHSHDDFSGGQHQHSYPAHSKTFVNQMPPPAENPSSKRRPPLLPTPTNVRPVNWESPDAFVGSQPQQAHNSRVVQVGNVLQVVPAEQLPSGSVMMPSSPSQSFVLQSGNMLQVIPSENIPCAAVSSSSTGSTVSSKNNTGSQVVQVGNVLQVIPGPTNTTQPVTAVHLKATFVPPPPPAQTSPSHTSIPGLSKQSGMQLSPSPVITSPLQTAHVSAAPLPAYSPPASPFLTAPVVQASLISPVTPETSVPVQAGESVVPFMSALEMTQVTQMEEVERRRAERARRRQEKEKRRQEKEKRHHTKLKQAAEIIIKKAIEQEGEILDGTSDDIDLEEMRLIEEAMQEVPETGDDMFQATPPPSMKRKKKIPIEVKPLPPAGKGILVSPGFREKPVPTAGCERKTVKFADGVRPGEGTSPSAGEDLPSPPPPPRSLPKEKRFKKKKKKKIKVKIIRQVNVEDDDDEDEDDISPPPPPPGSPPPPPLFPYPGTYTPAGFAYTTTPAYTVLPGSDGSAPVATGSTSAVFTPLYHQHHHTTTTTHTTTVQFAPPPPPPAVPAPPPPPPPANSHVFKRECPSNP